MYKPTTPIALLISAAFLAGCQWHNPSLTSQTVNARITADITVGSYNKLRAAQPLPDRPMSLSEALARGQLYNVSHAAERARLHSRATELANNGFAGWPKLFARSNGRIRSNEEASVARRVTPTLLPKTTEHYTAIDEARATGALEASWNLLDFGLASLQRSIGHLSYLEDQSRHRHASRGLSTKITRAYWRLNAHQQRQKTQRSLASKVNKSLRLAQAKSRTDQDKAGHLFFIREITDIYRYLLSLDRAIADAPAEFNHLLNLKQHSKIALKPTPSGSKRIKKDHIAWVKTALMLRPEFQNAHRQLMGQELRNDQAILRLLPNITLLAGINLDTNSFTLNENWLEAGARASFNLLELLKYNKKKRLGAMRVAHRLRLIEAAANLLARQSAVAIQAVDDAEEEMIHAITALQTQKRIVSEIRRQVKSKAQPERILVKEEVLLALAQIRHDLSRADLETALARNRETHGLGPDFHNIPRTIERFQQAFEQSQKAAKPS